jgi:uncharacterized RDD family membrane protein YckC
MCGEPCTCSHPEATSILIDPEAYDASEEQFAASLSAIAAGSLRAASGEGVLRGQAVREGAGQEPPAGSRGAVAVRWNEGEGSQHVDQGAFWRNEVSSRLESYRARRHRPVRERSLPLDFERAVNREMTTGSLSTSLAEEEPPLPSDEELSPVGEDYAAAAVYALPQEPVPEAQAISNLLDDAVESNLIEFPRQPLLPVMPPSFEELAEAIIDRPRILDVPEEVESSAPLADINVAPQEEQAALEFELPLLVASMSRRVVAGLLDAFLVLTGCTVFASIVLKTGVPAPHDKTGVLVAMAVPCLFWAIYEYLFLVYSGTTPGMRLARLRLVTFDGEAVRRRARRARALTLVLSSLSLGLGVIWALLDEDTLCWHDRITRTYVVVGG